MFHDIVGRGDTYSFAPDTDEEEARRLWITEPQAAYVAVDAGHVLGSYYLKPNQPGLGAHVCNAGFMTVAEARGRGIGRAMGVHSMDEARRLGFLGMQFNFVASTNRGAIALWKDLGFEIVGTVPGAFRHPADGFVDVHVMYQRL